MSRLTGVKLRDTFRVDNRTRNASALAREPSREHRAFAIVHEKQEQAPAVPSQEEAL